MAYEYIANGQTIRLEVDEDRIAVRFHEPAPRSHRFWMTRRPELAAFSRRIEVPEEKYTILPVAQTPEPRAARFKNAISVMNAEDGVARVTPVFKIRDSKVLATDRLIVRFAAGAENPEKALRDQNGEVVKTHEDNEYLVRLPETADPFQVAETLRNLPDVEYAEPDFVILFQRFPRHAVSSVERRNDPLQVYQYAVDITQARQAWQLQIGDPRVQIAILDEGVDTSHEDLFSAIVSGYDATDDDPFQEPKFTDAHGTACAGLAAAIPDNFRGIQGIGGGCSLMAVRIAYSGDGSSFWVTNDAWVIRAIDWAWQNGADILSNSWGGGPPSTAVTQALERARTRGRNGKGCVVIIAAGNAGGWVDFPGYLPNMLTVAASNEYDEPKTRDSRDGETWWGSNFGPEVDVAAPGVHLYTTDIMGQAGYNQAIDGHYYAEFNGTSGATPIVAGAAGLMLSANPDLTEAQVREIIRQTADKVGPIPYINGRNDSMGYGRLNVYRAVREAQERRTVPRPPIEPPVEPLPGDSGGGDLRMRVTASRLRIRTGPGTQYPSVGFLDEGEIVSVNNLDGREVWVEIAPGKWAAYTYRGNQFLQLVR